MPAPFQAPVDDRRRGMNHWGFHDAITRCQQGKQRRAVHHGRDDGRRAPHPHQSCEPSRSRSSCRGRSPSAAHRRCALFHHLLRPVRLGLRKRRFKRDEGFRIASSPPALDFCWRNIRTPSQSGRPDKEAIGPEADNRSAGLRAYGRPLRSRPAVVHLCVGQISIR
jgi:hypothetical protein